ncbi:EMB2654 [Symbiodinium sp. CCMP2592]|nr:EMB2654 [Symbiodinium sp. CCMP2592]
MPQRAVNMNAVSYNSALRQGRAVAACPCHVPSHAKVKDPPRRGRAIWLLSGILERSVPVTKVGNGSKHCALISCCKGGQWQLALSVLDRMPKAKIAPNAISYTSAMGACEKGGQWLWALELFSQLCSSKFSPNAISHSCALSACQSGAQWQRALVLFSEMFLTQLSPDVVSYSAALAACARGGRWRLAIHLFEGMKEYRIRPNVVAYNAALDCLQQREAGDSLLREAIRDGIFDPLRRETPCDMLDLHEMSSGAAKAALLWWLRDVLPPQLGDADSLACTIITGWGRSRRPWQQANIQADVLVLLRRFGLPAKVIQSNHGRVELQLTRKDLKSFEKKRAQHRHQWAFELEINPGKTNDLTPLLKEYDGPLAQPIIAAAGSDISFWFDEESFRLPGLVPFWKACGEQVNNQKESSLRSLQTNIKKEFH